MTSFLSHLHAELRRTRLTRRGSTHHPDDVPRGAHKEYPRMPRIQLPEPEMVPMTLQEALQKRRSASSGNPEAPVSLREIGTLLGSALGVRANSEKNQVSRNYPSGGALYPIETYLIST